VVRTVRSDAMKKAVFLSVLASLAAFGSAAAQETGCPASPPAQVYAAYVKAVQLELNLVNFDAGPPNGETSPKTTEAVSDYQRQAGLPVDGCITQTLVDRLRFVLPKTVKPRGSHAKPDVVEAQTLLSRRGFYLGAVDGIAGRRTRAALHRFQEAAGLPAKAVIDSKTIESIKTADPTIRGDRAAP